MVKRRLLPSIRGHTSLSAERRGRDPVWQHALVGAGADVGPGLDPLLRYRRLFPDLEDVILWHGPEPLPPLDFDWIYVNHVLEHIDAPENAVRHWIDCLRPGGVLLIGVPDENTYERGQWPSRGNPDHLWSFRMFPFTELPKSLHAPTWFRQFAGVAVERVELFEGEQTIEAILRRLPRGADNAKSV